MNEQEKFDIERQRLELEREKFEFEKQKFQAESNQKSENDFFKSVLSNSNQTNSNKPNYIGIVGAVALIVSCLLPWVESSGSFMGYSSSFSASGFETGHGYYVTVFALAAMLLAYRNNRFLFIPALLAFLDGLSVVAGVGSWSGNFGGASARAGFAIGPVITILSSAVIIVSQFFSFSKPGMADGTPNFPLKQKLNALKLNALLANKYFIAAISLTPLIPTISLSLIYHKPTLLLLIILTIPLYLIYKDNVKVKPYILSIISIVALLILLENFSYAARKATSLFELQYSSKNYTEAFIFYLAKGLSVVFYLAVFAYLVTILSSYEVVSSKIPSLLKGWIIGNSKKTIKTMGGVAAFITVAGFSYHVVSYHEPTDEEKQILVQHFAPLEGKWTFFKDDKKHDLSFFSAVSIKHLEGKNGGSIEYEINGVFNNNFITCLNQSVSCKNVRDKPKEILFKNNRYGISMKINSWNIDSITGVIFSSSEFKTETPFVAYSEEMLKKVQVKLAIDKLVDAQKRPSILEGIYKNYSDGYSSFADVKLNSDGNLTLQEGSADGDVSLDPLSVAKEYKLIENKLFIKGESSYSPGELIDLGAFTYNPETQKYELIIRDAVYSKD
jgi:hypothetical protein